MRRTASAKQGLKKGAWSSEEDQLLINYINQHGHGHWRSLPKKAGLQRCGLSCRRRWTNYLAGEMGRTPCCDNQGLKTRPWSSEEDEILINYINQHGHGTWSSLPKKAGLQRSRHSCKHRWTVYLRPGIKRRRSYDNQGLKKGPWSSEEDKLLINYINEHGHGDWTSLAKNAGLQRRGFSCRFRWTKYLRPDIKRGPFTPEEENLVIQLHTTLGNSWSAIAIQLPGRTDNAIKNLWFNHLKKRLVTKGLDPQIHEPTSNSKKQGSKPPTSPSTRHMAQWESARLEAEARLSEESLIYNPHSSSSSYSDVFLPLWETEVGESFQKLGSQITCQSPVSETSSSTKCASNSDPTQRDKDVEVKEDSKSHAQLLNARSNSSCSDVAGDSTVSALQLFWDFPEYNDMSFVENDIYDYLVF